MRYYRIEIESPDAVMLTTIPQLLDEDFDPFDSEVPQYDDSEGDETY